MDPLIPPSVMHRIFWGSIAVAAVTVIILLPIILLLRKLTNRSSFKFKERFRIRGQREGIPEKVRREVWRRDGGRCAKCGSQEKLEYDHIIPLSKGGSNTARNIQLLCESCNRKKSDKI